MGNMTAMIPKENRETHHSYLHKPKRRVPGTEQTNEIRNQKDTTCLRESLYTGSNAEFHN